MNLPNKLTLSRIFLIPVFIIIFSGLFEWGTFQINTLNYEVEMTALIAAIIFAILSSTDWLDGYIARKYNLVTNFGKFLDPLADKLLTTAGFVMLVQMQYIPAWMVIVILSREFAVTGLRLVVSMEGTVIAAAKLGKIKTVFQIITVMLFLLNITGLIPNIILWFTVLITVWSGVEYFLNSKEVLLKSK